MSMASSTGRRISAPLAFRVGDDATAPQIAEAVIVMWNEIDDALTPVLGGRGLVALYRRTLHLMAATRPDLAAGGPKGVLLATEPTLLRALIARQGAEQAAILGSAFLLEFKGLVASLIGPSLNGRLLRAVWLPPSSSTAAQDTSS